MAYVEVDSSTRAPSPSWAKLVRFLGTFVAAKLTLWAQPFGLTLTPEDQLWIAAGVAAVVGAIGTEARDRGWPVLRHLAMPLVFGLVVAGPLACKTATPREAWGTALATYSAAAAGMAVYCDLPDADAEKCIEAARATLVAEPIIAGTQDAIQSGTASEALLENSTETLQKITGTVEEAR